MSHINEGEAKANNIIGLSDYIIGFMDQQQFAMLLLIIKKEWAYAVHFNTLFQKVLFLICIWYMVKINKVIK